MILVLVPVLYLNSNLWFVVVLLLLLHLLHMDFLVENVMDFDNLVEIVVDVENPQDIVLFHYQ